MANAKRELSIRLAVDNSAQSVARLQAVGTSGDHAMAKIHRGAKQADRSMAGLITRTNLLNVATKAAGVAVVAMAGAAGFALLSNRAIKAGDAIAKTSDRIGISTDTLQEYRHAADLAGVSTEQLDSGFEAFTKRLGEARAGTGTMTTLIQKMDAEFLKTIVAAKSSDDALGLMLAKIGSLSNQADKAALSAAAFGRSAGVGMTLLVKDGTAALEGMRKEARDLGLVIEEHLLRQAEETTDKLSIMASVIDAQTNTALLALAPLIADIAVNMTAAAIAVGKFYGAFQDIGDRTSSGLQDSLAELKADLAAGQELLQAFRDSGSAGNQLAVTEKRIAVIEARIAKVQGALNARATAASGKGSPLSIEIGPSNAELDYAEANRAHRNRIAAEGMADVEVEFAKKAADERELIAKAAREKIFKDWTAANERSVAEVVSLGLGVSGVLRDSFRDGLDGSLTFVESFAARFENIMFDTIANIAEALVFQPIINGVVGGIAGGNPAGGGSGLAAGGGSGLAGSIAQSIVGKAIGGPISEALGLDSISTSISSALGFGGSAAISAGAVEAAGLGFATAATPGVAAAGGGLAGGLGLSAFAGPLAIGVIGALALSGILGGGEGHYGALSRVGQDEDGRAIVADTGAKNADPSSVIAEAQKAADLLNLLIDAGASIDLRQAGEKLGVELGIADEDGQRNQSAAQLVQNVVASGAVTGLSDQALALALQGASVAQIQLAELAPALTAAGTALGEFAGQVQTASTEAARAAAYYTSAAVRLGEAAGALGIGALSPLSPEQRLTSARGIFTNRLAAAQGGDRDAIGALAGAGSALLSASRDFNASSGAYTQDFDAVVSALGQTQAISEGLAADASAEVLELGKHTNLLGAIVANLAGAEGPNADLLRQQLAALEVLALGSGLSASAVSSAVGAVGEQRADQVSAATARAASAAAAPKVTGLDSSDTGEKLMVQYDRAAKLSESKKTAWQMYLVHEWRGLLSGSNGPMQEFMPNKYPNHRQPGFEFGGDFVVPGSGGPDSQNVGFRATPGEIVTVQPPNVINTLLAQFEAQRRQFARMQDLLVEINENTADSAAATHKVERRVAGVKA